MEFDHSHFTAHCSYCKKSGHYKPECKILNKHALYKKCNIPEKYWHAYDPIKALLMGENIRGFIHKTKNEELVQKRFQTILY
jgi:hypothetical protein